MLFYLLSELQYIVCVGMCCKVIEHYINTVHLPFILTLYFQTCTTHIGYIADNI